MSWAETKTINSNPQVPLNKIIATEIHPYTSEDIANDINSWLEVKEYFPDDKYYYDEEPLYEDMDINMSSIDRSGGNNTLYDYSYVVNTPETRQPVIIACNKSLTATNKSDTVYSFSSGYVYVYFPHLEKTVKVNVIDEDWMTLTRTHNDSAYSYNTNSSMLINLYPLPEVNRRRYILKVSASCTCIGTKDTATLYPDKRDMTSIGILEITEDNADYIHITNIKSTISKNNNTIPDKATSRSLSSTIFSFVSGKYIVGTFYGGTYNSNSVSYNNDYYSFPYANNSNDYTVAIQKIINLDTGEVLYSTGMGYYSSGSGSINNAVNNISDRILGYTFNDQLKEYSTSNNYHCRYIYNGDTLRCINGAGDSASVSIIDITATINGRTITITSTTKFSTTTKAYTSGRYVADYMTLYGNDLVCFPPLNANYSATPFIIRNAINGDPYIEYLYDLGKISSSLYNILCKVYIDRMGAYNPGSSHTFLTNKNIDIANVKYLYHGDREYTGRIQQSSTDFSTAKISIPSARKKTCTVEEIIDLFFKFNALSYIDIIATKNMKVLFDSSYIDHVEGDYTDIQGGVQANSDGLIRLYRKFYTDIPYTLAY